MSKEPLTSKPLLRGALARIERRATTEIVPNEFGRESSVSFRAERRIVPTLDISTGIKSLLEVAIRAHYIVFRGDDDYVCARAEENAMRALCRCLYEDVLDDLMPIMQAVGDGKRAEALRLLDALYVRLNGQWLT